MRILLLILVPPVLLFGLALLMLWLPLPPPFPPPLSDGRSQMAAALVGMLGFGYLIGLAAYVISAFRQAGRALDPVFAQRGLATQSYQGFGRQYRGYLQGRQVEVHFFPSRAIQPALLNIYVDADLDARVAIGKNRPLLDCRGCAPVDIGGPALNHFQAYADEPEWARSLLAEPTNRATVSRLMEDQRGKGTRELYLQPGRVWLRARPSSSATADDIRRWFDDLLALVQAIERQ